MGRGRKEGERGQRVTQKQEEKKEGERRGSEGRGSQSERHRRHGKEESKGTGHRERPQRGREGRETGKGLPRGVRGKESTCQCRRLASIPESGRSPGVGNGNSLQHSCLGNPMDRGAWWATALGVAKYLEIKREQTGME